MIANEFALSFAFVFKCRCFTLSCTLLVLAISFTFYTSHSTFFPSEGIKEFVEVPTDTLAGDLFLQKAAFGSGSFSVSGSVARSFVGDKGADGSS